MTDERLLVEFLTDRDGSAFEALVRRHGPMVLRVCRDVLGEFDLAEDAFQATFLVLARRAGSIRDRGSVGRWLYEVACRISKRERQRLVRTRFQERQAPEMEAAAPRDFDPADRELKPILHEEIGRLPSKVRDAIVLCYFEGLTVEDAARRLGCPVGTLKSRLVKGREMLRARLTRRGLAASILLLLLFSLTEGASAAVPASLLDSTLKVGPDGPSGIGVSRRVASMVLEEEASRRHASMAVKWSILLVLLIAFGASQVVQGRNTTALLPTMRSPNPPISSVPPGGTVAVTAPGDVADHCR